MPRGTSRRLTIIILIIITLVLGGAAIYLATYLSQRETTAPDDVSAAAYMTCDPATVGKTCGDEGVCYGCRDGSVCYEGGGGPGCYLSPGCTECPPGDDDGNDDPTQKCQETCGGDAECTTGKCRNGICVNASCPGDNNCDCKFFSCSSDTACSQVAGNYWGPNACSNATGSTCYSRQSECLDAAPNNCPAPITFSYCVSYSQCTTGQFLTAAECQAANGGRPCYQSADACQRNLATDCPPGQAFCQASCDADNLCQNGQECVEGLCVNPECPDDPDCSCTVDCGDECQIDADCPAGHMCSEESNSCILALCLDDPALCTEDMCASLPDTGLFDDENKYLTAGLLMVLLGIVMVRFNVIGNAYNLAVNTPQNVWGKLKQANDPQLRAKRKLASSRAEYEKKMERGD